MNELVGSGSNRHRFLIVDDEPDVLDSVRRLFRKDYELFLALSASEAFEILEREEIHLLMTDQRMPEMSGVNFLSQVKDRYPHVVRMLFTGYGDLGAVVEAINRGSVYRYINKPYEPSELKTVVAQAAERYDILNEKKRLAEELSRQNLLLERHHDELEKAYGELQGLDRLKTVFMGIVNHELNTPTSIILGFSSLLLRDEFDDPSSKNRAIERINASGKRLKDITDKIAKMMATEPTLVKLDLQPLDAGILLGEIVAELDPVLQSRKQQIITTLEAESMVLLADHTYLKDLLMNLVVNAIKFSPDGSSIWLSAVSGELNEQPTIDFLVRDEGIGIQDEDRDSLFESFFGTFQNQHHSSGSFGFEKRGLGLGLAIVKRFAEMHGGKVQLDTEVGIGSTFSVRLPIDPRS